MRAGLRAGTIHYVYTGSFTWLSEVFAEAFAQSDMAHLYKPTIPKKK